MPTARQKRAAKLIIENETLDIPKTGGEIVESSGYGVSMKKNPQVVLESDGVKEALINYGFSEDNAKQVVSEIMLDSDNDPNARLKATDQVFKVHGSYAPEKSAHVNINVNTTDSADELRELALKVREQMRKDYANGNI